MEKFDFNDVSSISTGYKGPGAGGYVATIVTAVDNPDKQYLQLGLDIAEGEFAGYYKDLFERAGFWGLNSYRSYKPKARGFFKAFIEAVEKSNDNFTWNWYETELINLTVGIIIGLEDYIGNDGKIKTRPRVTDFVPVVDIKDGNFTIPEHIKIETTTAAVGVVDASEETPF